MVLGYHDSDFVRTGSPYLPSESTLMSSQTGVKELFNGNISTWTLKRNYVNGTYKNDQKGFMYTYDQLNRLKNENYSSYASGSWASTTDFDNSFTYDANGNILSLLRNSGEVSNSMDDLLYRYPTDNNKLNKVYDAISTALSDDIEDQDTNNYRYDKIGNLTSDQQEGIDSIHWTVYGKVRKVVKSSGDSLEYIYDAAGNKVQQYAYVNGVPKVTYYLRDASGNIMSTYLREVVGANHVYTQLENNIFGSDRLGLSRSNVVALTVDTAGPDPNWYNEPVSWTVDIPNKNGFFTRTIANKEYELKDHLGNVRVVVSDRKNAGDSAVILNYNNYYAFGMKRPGTGQNYDLMTGLDNSTGYRYGYNGKEMDFKFHDADGEVYDFGARMYDARLGRWLSIEPHATSYPFLSAYAAYADNPINFIDPDGKDIIVLRNSDGAHGAGHGAILVGNNKEGWTYISKDGYTESSLGSESKFVVQKFSTLKEFRNSPHNFVLEDGTHSTKEGKEASSFNYKLDDGKKIQRYDEALFLPTRQADGTSTDAASVEAATKSAEGNYCLGVSDCSDVIKDGLNASKDSQGEQIKNGELKKSTGSPTLDLYQKKPNIKFNRIAKRNKSAKQIDAGLIPDK